MARTDERRGARRAVVVLTYGLAAAGCAETATRVLPPYQLANGRVLQDVVTVAADPSGGAPVVTSLTTFDVSRGGATRVVSQASASAPGTGLMVAKGLGSGASTLTAVLVADAIDDEGDTVNASYATSGNSATDGGNAGDIDAVTGSVDGSGDITN